MSDLYTKLPQQRLLEDKRNCRIAIKGLKIDINDAYDKAADAFLRESIKNNEIDLHGLIVREALCVVKKLVSYCQQNKVRKFRMILGPGNHSKRSRGARLLPLAKSFLTKKGVAFTEDSTHGVLTLKFS